MTSLSSFLASGLQLPVITVYGLCCLAEQEQSKAGHCGSPPEQGKRLMKNWGLAVTPGKE